MAEESSNAEVSGAGSDFNWSEITNGAQAGGARTGGAPAPRNLPPFPPNTGILAGRLPIQGGTGKAIIQLPEPMKDVHCAIVIVNSGVTSDCYNQAKNVCIPTALRGRPLNDREIEVILDGGDQVAKGLGWSAGNYPGGMPETRSIEVGVPYVEALVLVGVGCGCDSENWAPENEWG